MMVSKKIYCLLAVLFFVSPVVARDKILEFKGAYFLPTGSVFKDIYGGGALYGPEITFQLCENKNWYGFASIDYFRKKGHSKGLCEPTTVKLVPIAFGIKYMYPLENFDLYAGLGIQPINVRTKNCMQSTVTRLSQWGLGGIAKLGAYYYLPHRLVLDFFVDYSFAKVGSNSCDCPGGMQSVKTKVSGAIFGVGLGYNFDCSK